MPLNTISKHAIPPLFTVSMILVLTVVFLSFCNPAAAVGPKAPRAGTATTDPKDHKCWESFYSRIALENEGNTFDNYDVDLDLIEPGEDSQLGDKSRLVASIKRQELSDAYKKVVQNVANRRLEKAEFSPNGDDPVFFVKVLIQA